ncbi:hypothetical protein D3C72_1641910 [compost metagenome]
MASVAPEVELAAGQPEGRFGRVSLDHAPDLVGQGLGHPLVGVDEQDPVAGGGVHADVLVQVEVLALVGVHDHMRRVAPGHLGGLVDRLVVDHHDLVGERQALQASGDAGGLVVGDHDGAETGHRWLQYTAAQARRPVLAIAHCVATLAPGTRPAST